MPTAAQAAQAAVVVKTLELQQQVVLEQVVKVLMAEVQHKERLRRVVVARELSEAMQQRLLVAMVVRDRLLLLLEPLLLTQVAAAVR